MRLVEALRKLTRELIKHRLLLSFGLSTACGLVLQSIYPISDSDPVLRLIAIERPALYHGVVWSYALFLYSTPFLVLSILFSLTYVHFYLPELDVASGRLPVYPNPRFRKELFLVLGEVHQQTKPNPAHNPYWLAVPERGLYTGICVIGATGSARPRA